MSYALTSLRAAVVIMFSMLSGVSVYAAETTLAVSGNVIASGCDVDTGSINQKVKIGTFSGKDFPTVGSASAFKAMNINLSNCYEKLSTIQVKFSGVSDADNPTLLAISDTGGGRNPCNRSGRRAVGQRWKNHPV